MSTPISACLIHSAALGNEDSYKLLLKFMRENIYRGHWCEFPCQCDPPCDLATNEQIDALNTRIDKDTADIKRGGYYDGMFSELTVEQKAKFSEILRRIREDGWK